jgi:3-oxoacyl-(acyl-carrier-protein) synthase
VQHSIKFSDNAPICILTGWHNAADAYHQTASSPDGKGATIAMKNALNKAKLEPDEISYINAHGTGTKNNDLSESIAIKNVFGKTIPPFSSTKAFTGHTLAAAGAIEAVYSVLAIKNSMHFSRIKLQ